ncbi:acetyl-coenzyme A synthetase, partial [Escherichia coli]
GDAYFAGDGARKDEDGEVWLLGRVDDVMNVSGHRLSTAEIESSLVAHSGVAEAAVVGATDATTGQAVVAFVILKQSASEGHSVEEAEQNLRQHVASDIGACARRKQGFIVPDLPKTRSGKSMRRLLRDLAEGRALGDTTTLADQTVVDAIQSQLR